MDLIMETMEEASMLRIYLSNTDKFKSSPLYEMIVFAARRNGLAGTTVIKGVMGYGSSSVVHSAKFWEITGKLPVVVEIVDETEKIEKFIEVLRPWFDKIRTGCLITVEPVVIRLWKKGRTRTRPV
jgi:PII-like signaling protein